MKISKLFHWLYFSVMMLPIFIIPIFAIFSRNENYNSNIELQVEENKVVNFNQLINIKQFNYNYDIINSYSVELSAGINAYYNLTDDINIPIGNKFYFRTKSDKVGYRFVNNHNFVYTAPDSTFAGVSYISTSTSEYSTPIVVNQNADLVGTTILKVNVIDLTVMFGAGNEPTKEQFESWYLSFYDYTLSDIQLLKNYGTLTYNDTDVGSQYLYTMYNGVDKYFNYDKVFNFGSLYDWLQLTFFDGNATLGFFIFWHLLIYWLLTSLLWLLFDVLLYVPNLIHRWLDKASLS